MHVVGVVVASGLAILAAAAAFAQTWHVRATRTAARGLADPDGTLSDIASRLEEARRNDAARALSSSDPEPATALLPRFQAQWSSHVNSGTVGNTGDAPAFDVRLSATGVRAGFDDGDRFERLEPGDTVRFFAGYSMQAVPPSVTVTWRDEPGGAVHTSTFRPAS